jgi:hypothetical protein
MSLHSLPPPLTDDDGNVGRSLGGDVEARRVAGPDPGQDSSERAYVTELERSCDAATHYEGTYSAGLVERQ